MLNSILKLQKLHCNLRKRPSRDGIVGVGMVRGGPPSTMVRIEVFMGILGLQGMSSAKWHDHQGGEAT